mmetsp:Transcript_29766/g.46033  ORF Transcript_29766/g.46033 Transcript_29766/m.46033 type:complete len:224 (-) Transcript_29766:160-831(-)
MYTLVFSQGYMNTKHCPNFFSSSHVLFLRFSLFNDMPKHRRSFGLHLPLSQVEDQRIPSFSFPVGRHPVGEPTVDAPQSVLGVHLTDGHGIELHPHPPGPLLEIPDGQAVKRPNVGRVDVRRSDEAPRDREAGEGPGEVRVDRRHGRRGRPPERQVLAVLPHGRVRAAGSQPDGLLLRLRGRPEDHVLGGPDHRPLLQPVVPVRPGPQLPEHRRHQRGRDRRS